MGWLDNQFEASDLEMDQIFMCSPRVESSFGAKDLFDLAVNVFDMVDTPKNYSWISL